MATDFTTADLGNDSEEVSLRKIVASLDAGNYSDADSRETALRKLRYLVANSEATIDGGNATSSTP